MVAKINGVILEDVEDARTATHVIVSDGVSSIRRTPKLMIALCRTPNIVSLNWLTKSALAGIPLPCTEEFLVLSDNKAESQYSFSMRETIQQIKMNQHQNTFLFSNYNIFVCSGVFGNKAPPEKELRLIVQAAGGTWINSTTQSSSSSSKPIIVITSDPETKKQVNDIKGLLSKNKDCSIVKKTTTWLFHTMMTQQLKF